MTKSQGFHFHGVYCEMEKVKQDHVREKHGYRSENSGFVRIPGVERNLMLPGPAYHMVVFLEGLMAISHPALMEWVSSPLYDT